MNVLRHALLLLTATVLSVSVLSAQAKLKTNVGVAPLQWSPRTADATYVSMIYDHLNLLLNRNSAVTVVDRGSWKEIQEERELLKTEPFILTETIEQGRSAGAEKLLTGKVYLTDIQPEGTGYAITFSLYLAVVDVETATIEDNISVSPRGAEDTDKMIEILKAVRKAQILPNNYLTNKMINMMELADVLAKYEVGGMSQDDSFKEALNQLDKTLIPFFDYHFGGKTGSYKPSNEIRATVKESYTASQEVNTEAPYQIVERLTGNRLRILGGELDGIQRTNKMELTTATTIVDTTLDGKKIEELEERVWGVMSFEKYEGDFSVFTLDKKNEFDIATILSKRPDGSLIYVKNPKPSTRKVPAEERKFSIVSIEDDQKIKIVGKAEDGIKKSSRFSLVRETIKEFEDFNGEKGSGILREELATFKFNEDRTNFQILELEKGSDKTTRELIGAPKVGEKVFILFKLKDY